MIQICHIIGAGTFTEKAIASAEGDLVIAADGGYAHLETLPVKTDIIIGDLDSLSHIPKKPALIRYPKEKEETDMMLAVREGLRRAYRLYLLYGGLGGRLDHTLANIQTLAYLSEQGASGYLVGRGIALTAMKDSRILFPDHLRGIVSVFSLSGNASGVTIKGLKYELAGASLSAALPIGISNEFTGRPSLIEVKAGTLLVLWDEDVAALADRIRNERINT